MEKIEALRNATWQMYYCGRSIRYKTAWEISLCRYCEPSPLSSLSSSSNGSDDDDEFICIHMRTYSNECIKLYWSKKHKMLYRTHFHQCSVFGTLYIHVLYFSDRTKSYDMKWKIRAGAKMAFIKYKNTNSFPERRKKMQPISAIAEMSEICDN